MTTPNKSTPHTILTALAAALFLTPLCPLPGQTTYTYSDPSIGAGTPNYWNDSAKWGLPAPEYPNAPEVIVQLPRVAGDDSVRVHMELPTPNVTIGQLSIIGASGNARWTIGGSNTQEIILGNGSNPAVISSASSGIVRLVAKITSLGGTRFISNGSIFVEATASSFDGGITVEGAGDVRFYGTGMLGSNVITLVGTGGSIRFGNTGATKNIINNDFILETVGGKKGIYTNNSTGIQLNGNISGPGGLLLGTGSSGWNDTTELFGQNSYEGETEIRTNVVFRSLNNFGDGAITFASNARTLTFDGENSADITTNAKGEVRAVVINVQTTFDIGNNDVTFANALTGSAGFTLNGSGSLKLLGNNALSQVILQQGKLIAGHQNALGGTNSQFTVHSATVFELLSGTHAQINQLNLLGDAQFAFTLNHNHEATQLEVLGNQIGAYHISISISEDSQLIAGTYTLLSINGSYDPGLQFSLDPNSTDFGTLSWNNGILTFTVIPEARFTSLMLASLAAILVFYLRRSRK